MKLSEIKGILPSLKQIKFQLDRGSYLPGNFQISEVGVMNKDFMDVGGTIRHEKKSFYNSVMWNQ